MKKFFKYVLLTFLFMNTTNIVKAYNNGDKDYTSKMKQDILCLMMAYPEHIVDISTGDNGQVYLVMKSGKKILYDDKREKNFNEKINNPDLQDMMEQTYPLNSIDKIMEKNLDPGRFRVYPLLNEVYGSSRQQIEKNLAQVNIVYRRFQFNKNNKASESLQKAMNDVTASMSKNPNMGSCVYPCSGTYNYRVISGTGQLSPHAFGIAIDLASDKRDYWKWATIEQGEQRLKSYSKELVEIFESNNFVWGGKWSHFDILHFEYRPEIIFKARYFGNGSQNSSEWYNEALSEKEDIKSYIEKIDNVLK